MADTTTRSPWRNRAAVSAIVLQLVLSIAPCIDLARRPPEAVRGPKRLWYLALLLNGVTPLVWYLWRRQIMVLGIAPSAYLAIGRRRMPAVAEADA